MRRRTWNISISWEEIGGDSKNNQSIGIVNLASEPLIDLKLKSSLNRTILILILVH